MIAVADVAVSVSNARESAEWWEQKLGFSLHTVGPVDGHAVMVAPPGDRFILHLCEGFEVVEPGNTGIAFVTDEIDELVRRMERGGVRFTEPLQKQEWGASAKFADPDGNIYWLLGAPTAFIRREVTRRPRAAARRRGKSPPRTRQLRQGRTPQ